MLRNMYICSFCTGAFGLVIDGTACALTCDPVASGSGLLPLYVIIQSISHSPNKPTDRHSIDQTENFVRMYLCLEEYCAVLYCFQRHLPIYFSLFVWIVLNV
jgi:hypothetical protein